MFNFLDWIAWCAIKNLLTHSLWSSSFNLQVVTVKRSDEPFITAVWDQYLGLCCWCREWACVGCMCVSQRMGASVSAGGRPTGGHATRIISASHSNHIVTPSSSSSSTSGFDAASHDNTMSQPPQSSATSRPLRDYGTSFPRYKLHSIYTQGARIKTVF